MRRCSRPGDHGQSSETQSCKQSYFRWPARFFALVFDLAFPFILVFAFGAGRALRNVCEMKSDVLNVGIQCIQRKDIVSPHSKTKELMGALTLLSRW